MADQEEDHGVGAIGKLIEVLKPMNPDTRINVLQFVFKELNFEALPKGAGRASREDLGAVAGWSDEKIEKLIRENGFSLKKITKTYVSEAERQAIVDALAKTQWNRKKAAELLGVSYKTLLGRIDEFRLKP